MKRLNELLKGLEEWRTKTRKFMFALPISAHESYSGYLPSYYRTEAWFLEQIAQQYELELEDGTYPVEVKKVKKENYY